MNFKIDTDVGAERLNKWDRTTSPDFAAKFRDRLQTKLMKNVKAGGLPDVIDQMNAFDDVRLFISRLVVDAENRNINSPQNIRSNTSNMLLIASASAVVSIIAQKMYDDVVRDHSNTYGNKVTQALDHAMILGTGLSIVDQYFKQDCLAALDLILNNSFPNKSNKS